MRLRRIIETNPKPHKMRWKVGIIAALTSTMGVGYLAGPVQAAGYSDFKYITMVPPQMPYNCKGLDHSTIKITGKNVIVEGVEVETHTVEFGRVTARYDIQKDGRLNNIKVIETNHACFTDNALAALSQWRAEPQSSVRKNVEVLLSFHVTGGEHDDFNEILNQILD